MCVCVIALSGGTHADAWIGWAGMYMLCACCIVYGVFIARSPHSFCAAKDSINTSVTHARNTQRPRKGLVGKANRLMLLI